MKRSRFLALGTLGALGAFLRPPPASAVVVAPVGPVFDPDAWEKAFGGGARVERGFNLQLLAVAYCVMWPDRTYKAILVDGNDDDALTYPELFRLLAESPRRKFLDLGDPGVFTIVKLKAQ